MTHAHQEAFVVVFAVVSVLGWAWLIHWSGRQR